MYIKRKIFSKKSENYDKKLKTVDKASIWAYKHLYTKGHKRAIKEAYEEGKDSGLVARYALHLGTAGAIGSGVAAHSLLGANKKTALAMGIPAGLAVGAAEAGAMKIGLKINRAARRRDPGGDIDRRTKRNMDLIRVADGEMSKKEFIKRHYK
jgi:hypothetical protein